jgi:diguanylate cyclase (GGDEF)-like protein/PAS domain S-box-containing protein
MREETSVTFRYLSLIALGYGAAILAVAAAVHFASAPALETMQADAKRSHLATKSGILRDILDELVLDVRILANNPDVQNYTLGETTTSLRAEDAILANPRFRSAALFDYKGRPLLSIRDPDTLNQTDRYLPIEYVEGLSDWVSGARSPAPRISYRPGDAPHSAHFLVSMPVQRAGITEGILTAETVVDLTNVLRADGDAPVTRLVTQFQLANQQKWTPVQTLPVAMEVPGTTFSLLADSDAQAIRTIGQSLIRTAILVAVAALAVPFGLMGVLGMRAIVTPHRELHLSKAELSDKSRELARLAQIAQMANEGVVVTNLPGHILWTNAAFAKITGYTAHEALGKKINGLLHGKDTDLAVSKRIQRALERREAIQAEILYYRKNNEPCWFSLSISPMAAGQDEDVQFAAIITDITEAKEARDELLAAREQARQQARHDPLTALPNRRALDDALDTLPPKSAPPRMLIRIDLDHFKNVNDTLGHAAGDAVLCQVATHLVNRTREDDLAARVGGDEFVVLLAPGATLESAQQLADRLGRDISSEMEIDGHACRIGASFGIASTHGGFISNKDLLKSADAALYLAKETGRGTTVLYSPQIHTSVLAKRTLTADIERGIANGEFLAWFQPQFDAQTNEVVGVEALARWQHPDHGILTPASFLPVAAQLGLIPDIDKAVFAYGLNRISMMNDVDPAIPRISFNVGVHQVMNQRLEETIKKWDLGKTEVTLEVLESVLVEDQGSGFLARLAELRLAGFRIEVDDFGSGHASVVGLQSMRPDGMKLDMSLVRPIDTSNTARELVKSMIDMGRALDISVTAEGVETATHAAILSQLGCDTLQGYHLARPMPFEELVASARIGFASDPLVSGPAKSAATAPI